MDFDDFLQLFFISFFPSLLYIFFEIALKLKKSRYLRTDSNDSLLETNYSINFSISFFVKYKLSYFMSIINLFEIGYSLSTKDDEWWTYEEKSYVLIYIISIISWIISANSINLNNFDQKFNLFNLQLFWILNFCFVIYSILFFEVLFKNDL